jgi:hypothetical protein
MAVMNRYVISLLTVVAVCAVEPSVAHSATLPASPYVVQPAFLPLRFGTIRPRGWILQQMRRDLKEGFAGHLDELCHEASSDIFASGRNRPGKSNNAGSAAGDSWWNGETEGNWHCGHFMLACLTGEPEALKKAKDYVNHILAAQDADGYLGIFSPELRYKGHGELWTQTCLFRGLLAYADATGDEKVLAAVKRAADRAIAGYAGCRKIAFTQHDPMFTDVLEQLHVRSGDKKYLDFGLRLYRECPNLKAFLQTPELRQPSGQTVFNACYWGGHGATVTEVMRGPLWFWNATGDEEFLRLGRGVVSAMDHWLMPSGALVSMEMVDRPPQPWDVAYEYCTIFEREFTLLSAVEKVGDAAYADAVEHLWFNAAQGSRVPDGAAVLYLSAENRLSVNDDFDHGQRFSPTHQHRAVCCNPNATRVASYYTAGMWMRPRGAEPAIAALLYGPSQMTADIAGSAVSIEEKTLYPYSGDVEMTMRSAKPATFCLWLRNPSWSRATQIVCPGAEVRQIGGFWQMRKEWRNGDKVAIHFDQIIREVAAINGEIALQYGPLLYVLPVRGTTKTIKTYPRAGFEDYLMSANKDVETKLALPAAQRANGFGFKPKRASANVANPDFPLDNPPVELEGKLIRESDGALVQVALVPIGAQSARLRRVTFPVVAAGKK